MRTFKTVQTRFNANSQLKPMVNGRTMTKRFKVCMKKFITIQYANESVLRKTCNVMECIFFEEIELQMSLMEMVKKKKDKTEKDQRKKKQNARTKVLANANGKRANDSDKDDSDIEGTPRGPMRRHMNERAIETDNGLEAFDNSIEKRRAICLVLEQKRLETQERIN